MFNTTVFNLGPWLENLTSTNDFPCLGIFWSILQYQVIYFLNKKTKNLIQSGNTDDFYLFHRNTSNYRSSESANKNKRLNAVRIAVSQKSQGSTRSAINEEIELSQNFDVISKINLYRIIMRWDLKRKYNMYIPPKKHEV